LDETEGRYAKFRIGTTLIEEVAACILGGYGIPAEVGLAAFYRLRDNGLLDGSPPSERQLISRLIKPLNVNGREIKYRFARQRSHYLSIILQKLNAGDYPESPDTIFRDWLLQLPGVGYKTASWITRNWLNSDKVAIIDIHVYRAGLLAGFFKATDSVATNYLSMESQFICFADAIGVRPSVLDNLIWHQMRNASDIARSELQRHSKIKSI
jgi:N-glycosylase/DNA lyase